MLSGDMASIFSTRGQAGESEGTITAVQHDAQPSSSDEIFAQLDDQDFEILKTLERKGALDAFEVAGEARIPPSGVLEALGKLDKLCLVRIEEPAENREDARFVLNEQRPVSLDA
jgi:hypothetical protein